MYIIEFILIVVIKKMQHFVLKKYVKSFYIFFSTHINNAFLFNIIPLFLIVFLLNEMLHFHIYNRYRKMTITQDHYKSL